MASQNLDSAIENVLLQYRIEFINSCMLLLRCLANKWSSAYDQDGSSRNLTLNVLSVRLKDCTLAFKSSSVTGIFAVAVTLS